MPKPSVKPQVPGEPTKTTDQENANSSEQTSNTQKSPAAASSEETVTVSKAEMSELMSRLSALEQQQQQAPAARQAPVQDLPDASTINPDKIKTSVLTKQGWVVPTGLGSNPAAPKG